MPIEPRSPEAPPAGAAGLPFRPIHYLGSKLRALDAILEAGDRLDASDRPVCDLFAGSGTVAYAFSQTRPVIAADIQTYSATICEALLTRAPAISGAEFVRVVQSLPTYATLLRAAKPLLDLERAALSAASAGNLEPIASVLEEGALVRLEYGHTAASKPLRLAQEKAAARLRLLKREAVCLRHFGGVFFSYAQALAFDALRAEVRRRGAAGSALTAALLMAMSQAVNTVGKQFAQPLRLRAKSGQLKKHLRSKVVHDRAFDPFALMASAVDSYRALKRPRQDHQVICADYRAVLTGVKGRVGLIYADPPYTRDHYSRYYHVLETIAVGDDPDIALSNIGGGTQLSRGLYRTDRHQSEFCIRSKAPEAFRALFRGAFDAGAPLLLSYSCFDTAEEAHPRVVSVADVKSLAEEFFSHVEVEELSLFNYSRLNHAQLHRGAEGTKEILISCRSG